jgi:hypothetical protein
VEVLLDVGVPEMVAVPAMFVPTLRPDGNVPLTETVGTGEPVLVIVNEKGTPVTIAADGALVMAGIRLTTIVSERLATPAADVAVITIG